MEESEWKLNKNEWSFDQDRLLSCILCKTAFNQSEFCPITLTCGHTLCKGCLKSTADCKTCPKDEAVINKDIVLNFPSNSTLLFLCDLSPLPLKEATKKLIGHANLQYFDQINKCLEEVAVLLNASISSSPNRTVKASVLSRSITHLLIDLIQCQLIENEGCQRFLKMARSLVQCISTELILRYQNPQQLASSLWAAIRTRGCQFLGPVMQTKVLHLILDALKDSSALSRKVLVLNVVEKLENQFSQTSKTAVGHVVQLLYRASCFKVTKREDESSLMQLKNEFLTYESLRREHDSQILQIALEAGIRFTAEQWSQLLYADSSHKQSIQSIMDDMPDYYIVPNSLQEFTAALQKSGDPANLSKLMPQLEFLYDIQLNTNDAISWSYLNDVVYSVKLCLFSMIDFIHHHTTHKSDSLLGAYAIGKYKTSLCRDVIHRGVCPRGKACTFAHSEQEMERYRQRARKSAVRNQEVLSETKTTASRNIAVTAGLCWDSLAPNAPLTSSSQSSVYYSSPNPPDGAAPSGPHLSSGSGLRSDSQTFQPTESDIPALRVAAQGVLHELRNRKEEVMAELRKSHVATNILNQKLHYSGTHEQIFKGQGNNWSVGSNPPVTLTKSINALPKMMLSSKPSSGFTSHPPSSVQHQDYSYHSYPMSSNLATNLKVPDQTLLSLGGNEDVSVNNFGYINNPLINSSFSSDENVESSEYDSKFYWSGGDEHSSQSNSSIDSSPYLNTFVTTELCSKMPHYSDMLDSNIIVMKPQYSAQLCNLTSSSRDHNAVDNSCWEIINRSYKCLSPNDDLQSFSEYDLVSGDDVRSFWTSVRNDEEVPFTSEPTVSKFGPISRKIKPAETMPGNQSSAPTTESTELSQLIYEKQVNLTAHLIEINAQITAIAQNVRLREELDSLVTLERDLQQHSGISTSS